MLKTDLVIDELRKRRVLEKNKLGCITGELSVLYPEAKIRNFRNKNEYIRIGSNTHIRGELLVMDHGGSISIGDFSYIGENTKIWSGNSICIGSRVLIAHGVNILDTDTHSLDAEERHKDYRNIIQKGHYDQNVDNKPVSIEDDVWIGLNSIILKGVTIGKGAIVGAGSVITKDIPAFTVVTNDISRKMTAIEIAASNFIE